MFAVFRNRFCIPVSSILLIMYCHKILEINMMNMLKQIFNNGLIESSNRFLKESRLSFKHVHYMPFKKIHLTNILKELKIPIKT